MNSTCKCRYGNVGKRRQWILLIIFAISSVVFVAAQRESRHWPLVSAPQQSADQFPPQGRRQQDEELLKMEKENARRANEQRQLELKRDTERLLQLSNELKQYVDKTNENILSLEVIKKAEEIERLAKSVKEKMKGHY